MAERNLEAVELRRELNTAWSSADPNVIQLKQVRSCGYMVPLWDGHIDSISPVAPRFLIIAHGGLREQDGSDISGLHGQAFMEALKA